MDRPNLPRLRRALMQLRDATAAVAKSCRHMLKTDDLRVQQEHLRGQQRLPPAPRWQRSDYPYVLWALTLREFAAVERVLGTTEIRRLLPSARARRRIERAAAEQAAWEAEHWKKR